MIFPKNNYAHNDYSCAPLRLYRDTETRNLVCEKDQLNNKNSKLSLQKQKSNKNTLLGLKAK